MSAAAPSLTTLPSEPLEPLLSVVDLVRSGSALTRPELVRVSGLGRSIVTQRVEQAIELGLLEDGQFGPSTGGRAPRTLRFRADQGYLVCVMFGALNVGVGIADLSGSILASTHAPWQVTKGPEASLSFADRLLAKLRKGVADAPIWGVAIGVPGPVEFSTGRPVAPPIMPGWDGFDIRDWAFRKYGAPVWVDNDVNLMALGEYRMHEEGASDVLFVKVGSGIGAGLISDGKVHRGATGAAGDVGHTAVAAASDVICRCGQVGCLEAIAGGWALAQQAEAVATTGTSPYLTALVTRNGAIQPTDVAEGARNGDAACIAMIAKSGHVVGETVATLVNFFNPAVVAFGGTIATTGDQFLAAARETVYRRSLPLATRNLRIVSASPDHSEGLIGIAALLTERLFQPGPLRRWILSGSPRSDVTSLYGVAV